MKYLLLLLLVSAWAVGQTHTFGALDANNSWTGTNSFLTSIILGGTATKQVSGGPEWLSFQHVSASHVTIANFVGTETQARFMIDMQGNHEWGPGGSTDQNVLLGWSATGRLNLSGTSGGGLNIVRWTAPGVLEAQPRIGLNNDGSGVVFTDGTNPTDASLYRPAAGQLNILGAVGLGAVASGADNYPRVTLDTSGNGIKLGSGAVAPDFEISRTATAIAGVTAGALAPPAAAIGNLVGCSAPAEGAHAVANNCNAGCVAGNACTAGGVTHCEMYCNGSAWVETGR